MSIAAIKWANQQSLAVTPKAILKALAERANEFNQCWPSIQTISKDSGASRSSVKRYIKFLKEQKFINYSNRKNQSGRENTSNLYVLNIPKPSSSRQVQSEPTPVHDGPQTINELQTSSTTDQVAPKNSSVEKTNNKKPMTKGWEPDWKTLDQALENLGISHSFAAEQLDEFRMFWIENGSKRTSWNAAFLNHLQRQWPRFLQQIKLQETKERMLQRQINHFNSLYKNHRTTLEAVTDRSWADGIQFDDAI